MCGSAFSPFTLLNFLINPYVFTHVGQGENPIYSEENIGGNRVMVFIATFIAVIVYLGIVWTMYKSMVKNFDMTIRKQAR